MTRKATMFIIGLIATPFIAMAIIGYVYLGFWKTALAFLLVAGMVASVFFGVKSAKTFSYKIKKVKESRRLKQDICKLRREA
ncbi:MAG: hypothetical protein WA064_03730 [Candidatus Moraniibacteriota bacterium]